MRRGGVVRECDWTEEELALLRETYAAAPPLRLAALAERLGRNKANVCRKARGLGLTNQRRPKVAERKRREPRFTSDEDRRAWQSERQRQWLAANGHPRGALGLQHGAKAKEAISLASKRAWKDPSSGLNTEAEAQRRSDLIVARTVAGRRRQSYSRCTGGRRADLGDLYFRSSWEANYARYLNFLLAHGGIQAWAFEPKTFEFTAIKRGTRTYTPDFQVTTKDGKIEWHEVKGWMDAKSRTRLARMAKYYPTEVVRIIDAAWFRTANKAIAHVIPNWERPQALKSLCKRMFRRVSDGEWVSCALPKGHACAHAWSEVQR